MSDLNEEICDCLMDLECHVEFLMAVQDRSATIALRLPNIRETLNDLEELCERDLKG